MAKLFHKVRAFLYKNMLTDDPGDYFARVQTDRSLNIEDVCRSAFERGGADINPSTMMRAVEQCMQEMVNRLCDGFGINFGWFNAMMHIKGVFGPNDHFDPQKHQITVVFQQGEALRRYIADNVSVDVQGIADTSALIIQVRDSATGSIDSAVTSGANLFIYGKKIKVAGNHPDVGIYFDYNNADGQPTTNKVPNANIIVNNPQELIILIPAKWNATAMTLSIRTQYANSGRLLNEPRTITFDKPLHTA